MDGDNSDLLGSESPTPGESGGSGAAPTSAVDAVNKSLDGTPAAEDERQLVEKLSKEYTTAREFDMPARASFATDRRYAAGMADPRWASDANIIGSFIDILVGFIYAQNPDLDITAAEKVGDQPDQDSTDFAQTANIIVSRQWRDGGLKRTGKKIVRSSLTVGQGWFKGLMLREEKPQPQIEQSILDAVTLQSTLDAMKSTLKDGDGCESIDEQKAQIKLQIEGLESKKELANKTGAIYDFLRAEDFQCSLDVSNVMDHCEADWNSNDLYIPRMTAKARFPRLTDEDIKQASTFFQKQVGAKDMGQDTNADQGSAMAEGAFTKNAPSGQMGGNTPVEFVKVVELWDKRDGMIKTWVDGTKKWAIDPYAPPQATSRFYPYFGLAFYEVDGLRHPQSLVFRLRKLADEYANCRSNQRLNRERSVPGTVFNRGAMSVEDAEKIQNSVSMENIGILPTDSTTPIQNIVMAKPIGNYNPALYDTTPIMSDMQVVSGVQEALNGAIQGSSQPKTATESNQEQAGFNSRSGADRDTLEDLLTDCARYTLQTALQEIRPPLAQRIAGKKAFWPFGMDVEDIMTLVEVDLMAGTSGKPDRQQLQAAWSAVLPLLEKLMLQVRSLQATDPAMADAMENLVRETLRRMDDRLDLTQFIPTTPPPAPPPPPPPLPPVPKININLVGQLPPQDVQTLMQAEESQFIPQDAGGAAPPGSLPGGGGAPGAPHPGAPLEPQATPAGHPVPASVQSLVPHNIPGTSVPMPSLTAK